MKEQQSVVNVPVEMTFCGSQRIHSPVEMSKTNQFKRFLQKLAVSMVCLLKVSGNKRQSACLQFCGSEGVISSTFAFQLSPHQWACAGSVSFDSAHRSVQSTEPPDKHLATGDSTASLERLSVA